MPALSLCLFGEGDLRDHFGKALHIPDFNEAIPRTRHYLRCIHIHPLNGKDASGMGLLRLMECLSTGLEAPELYMSLAITA